MLKLQSQERNVEFFLTFSLPQLAWSLCWMPEQEWCAGTTEKGGEER